MPKAMTTESANGIFMLSLVAAPLLAGVVAYWLGRPAVPGGAAFGTRFVFTSVLGVFFGGLLGYLLVDRYGGFYMPPAFVIGAALQLVISPLWGLVVGAYGEMRAREAAEAKAKAEAANSKKDAGAP